jgi:hypothetical protein
MQTWNIKPYSDGPGDREIEQAKFPSNTFDVEGEAKWHADSKSKAARLIRDGTKSS